MKKSDKNLKEIYNDISKNPRQWLYFNDTNIPLDVSWNTEWDAWSFISNYFTFAGKKMATLDFLKMHKIRTTELKEMNRCRHIVSTFLLGIAIANELDIDLRKEYSNDISLLYLWFLSCLYHDMGYVYESHDISEFSFPSLDIRSLTDIKTNIGVIDQYLKDEFEIEHICEYEFETYSKELVYFYFVRRAQESNKTYHNKEKGKIDHGIIGGLMLYDRLIKQFEFSKVEAGASKNAQDFVYEVTQENTKYWLRYSKMHFPAYAKAANAVIMHNIWADTLIQYLTDLGLESEYSIDKVNTKNIICFLLSLADTLEPLKRYSKEEDASEMLEKIYLCRSETDRGICLRVEDEEVWNKCYKNIFDVRTHENKLDSWMDIRVLWPLCTSGHAVDILLNE